MAEGHHHIRKGIEEHRPVDAEGVPAEEDISEAEVAEGLERTPDGQLNRPDQPDASPEEKEQF